MSLYLAIAFLISLFCPGVMWSAENATLSHAGARAVDVRITRLTHNTLRVEYQVSETFLSTFEEEFRSFLISGEDETGGFTPISVTRWIALPDVGNFELQEISHAQSPLDNVDYPPAESVKIEIPHEIVRIGEESRVRGIRFVPIMFSVVTDDPETGSFQLVQNTVVEIDLPPEPPNLEKLGFAVRRMWGDLLLNNDVPRRDPLEGIASASYVFVMPADDAVMEIMEPLIRWRGLQGYTIREIIGEDDNESILERIQVFDRTGPPVEYVCLVGDAHGEFTVPAMMGGSSDYPYALIDGNNYFPEAAVGRLSYNETEELERIVDKILSYEQEPEWEDEDWLRRGAIAVGDEELGISPVLMGRWIRNLMLENEFERVDTLWWTMNSDVLEFMESAFDRGTKFINYRGARGIGDWTPHNAARLRNTYLPIAFFLSRNAGDYANGQFGFTEALLRAEGGAIGAIGTTGGQGWLNYNNAMMAGFYHGVFDDGAARLGWMLNRARLELLALFGDNGYEMAANHAFWTNLMGDPATIIWTGTPVEVEIEVPEEINIGDGELDVQVTLEDEPAAEVRIGLFQPSVNGIGGFAVAAYSDDNGVAHLEFDPQRAQEGEAFVTASGDGIRQVTEQTELTQPPRMMVYVSQIIIEDDFEPREGNDDGIINPLEIFEIMISTRNIGDQIIFGGLDFTLETEAEECAVLNAVGRYEFDVIAGEQVWQSFLIRAESDYPDREEIPFTLTVTSQQDEWELPFNLRSGEAPRLEYVEIDIIGGGLFIGGQMTFDILVTNSGSYELGESTTRLVSLNQLVDVTAADGEYDTIAVGDIAGVEMDFYEIQISVNAQPGAIFPFRLEFRSQEGYTGDILFQLELAGPPPDPFNGPDEYGYYAIDYQDVISNLAPVYWWEELSPFRGGSGTNTGMLDQGPGGDTSVVIPLPFTFQYYGSEFDEITICTNGWAAFGNQTEFVDFHNMPIGAPQGPRAQLCIWWEDLYQPGHSEGVFYQYDEENHRFIIEWFYMRRWIGLGGPGLPETCEIILLDPMWYPTYTGDGDIIFQYQLVHHEARVDIYQTPFPTIGIGNLEDDGGLQLSFWGQRPPGALVTRERSAVRFATAARHEYGLAKGAVLSTEDEVLAGATVRISTGGWAIADETGSFRIPEALADLPFTLTAMAQGYTDAVSEEVSVEVGDSVSVNFQLTHPNIVVDAEGFEDSLEVGEIVEHRFNVGNDGNGALTMTISLTPPGGNENLWEQLDTLNVTEETEDSRILGVACVARDVYVSGGNNGQMDNFIYLFRNNRMQRIAQPCQDLWGIHDLAWDGEHLFGGCADLIYVMDLNGDVVETIPSPMNPPRGLAVDPVSGEIWVVNEDLPIYRIDDDGNTLETYPHQLRPYGLAWHPADDDGFSLYIFSADGLNNLLISKLNPETGEIRTVTELDLEPGDRAGGCEITRQWDTEHWAFVAVIQNPDGDRIEWFNAGRDFSWITVDPEGGVIDPDGRLEVTLSLDSHGLTSYRYRADILISHNAVEDAVRIPVTMHLPENDVDEGESVLVPDRFVMNPVYPNPTNSKGIVSFTLPVPGTVGLSVWNMEGREVAAIYDGSLSAGDHRLTFEVNDLPSGVYFVRMSTSYQVKVQKFVLLK